MANLSKIKREKMLDYLEKLKEINTDDESIRAMTEIENALNEKKNGLVWEEHSEKVDEMLENNILGVNPSLKSVFKYIDDNIQKPISLEEASEYAHINKSYLSQLFKQKTGYTFSTYVNYRKLNRARKLLLQTEKNIAEISQECGYRNVSYFSTVFTKTVGISPGSFRKTGSAFKYSVGSKSAKEGNNGKHPHGIAKVVENEED